MINTLIIIVAAILMPVLLYFEHKDNWKGVLPPKITLSLLFIVAVLVQPHPISRYFEFILVGLVFCLVGDIFLALPWKKMFLLGLFSFLLGHIFYVLGFFYVARTSPWTWIGSLIFFVISSWVYVRLRPHLESMRVPVLIYVMVITLMLSGAWSVMGDVYLTGAGRIMIFAGAVSFYFSDIFVARDRFLDNKFLNRLFGLPMYYAGQFLIAFSVGYLG